MAGVDPKPKARGGLLTSDHSKRGRRQVTIVDPATHQVTLLDPWEHAVLVLCDGTRDAKAIAKLLEPGVEGESVDVQAVRRSLELFEHERLIEPIAGANEPSPSAERAPASRAGPRTLAGLQDAYREWHKDPVLTGQILSGSAPFDQPRGYYRAGLEPTVALPDLNDGDPRATTVSVGGTLVLADAESVIGGRRSGESRDDAPTVVGPLDVEHDVAELLEAVDLDFQEVESREAAEAATKQKQTAKQKPKHVPPPLGRATGGEARPPEAKHPNKPAVKVLMGIDASAVLVDAVDKLPAHRAVQLSEAALRPTMVGAPPPDGSPAGPPLLPVPARRRKSAAEIVLSELQLEGPTEGSLSSKSPSLPPRAREVFERLRRAGLKARASAEPGNDLAAGRERSLRRRDDLVARRFEQALERLSAGEIEVALEHFRRLQERMPDSGRLAAFIEAIGSLRTNAHGAVSSERLEQRSATQQILDDFRGALEDAVASGRCPSCFSIVQARLRECFACGFALDETHGR